MPSNDTPNTPKAFIVPHGIIACFANAGHQPIGPNYVYNIINSGKLKAKKMGKRTIVLEKDLHAFLDALPAYTPAGECE